MQSLKSRKKNSRLYIEILRQMANTALAKCLQGYRNIFKSQVSHETESKM